MTLYVTQDGRTIKDTDVLHYGVLLSDNQIVDWKRNDLRIRTIFYNEHIYYHYMCNGEIVEFKELI